MRTVRTSRQLHFSYAAPVFCARGFRAAPTTRDLAFAVAVSPLAFRPRKIAPSKFQGAPMGFATDAIHVGQEPDPTTGAIVAPIYQTSTYVQPAFGENKGFDYARTKHPNRQALERTMARLEGGTAAYVFSSGMAAIDSLFRLLRPGDHAIISEAVYGGVIRLTTQFLVQWGLEFSFVDTSSPDLVERAIRKNTRMIYVETPTNPTMCVTDIAAIAKISSAHNAALAVDNTFLSPYLQSPIALGAQIVVHSM